jgi:hypothetical protein
MSCEAGRIRSPTPSQMLSLMMLSSEVGEEYRVTGGRGPSGTGPTSIPPSLAGESDGGGVHP